MVLLPPYLTEVVEMVTTKEKLRMFESVLETDHTGPWRIYCRIPSQDQTGTCRQTAAAAPQSSPASLAASGSSYEPSHQGSPPSPAGSHRRGVGILNTNRRPIGTACWHRRGLQQNNNGIGARGLHVISSPTSLLDRFGGLFCYCNMLRAMLGGL
jgi:hypothetical protein